MSKNLNNFWDDCIEEKNLNLLISTKNNFSINSTRTKQSTSKNTRNTILSGNILNKFINNYNSKIKYRNINRKINNKTLLNKTKEILGKFSISKDNKGKRKTNKINNNKIYYKYGLNKNKSKNNLSTEELRLKKSLSECSFQPKLISNVKNKNLKEKLLNYSKFTMYERGLIFKMKKKEDSKRLYLEYNKKYNKQYPYKPEIHKCPSFKDVIFNYSNYDSLNYFYKRLNSARENRINKKIKMPFTTVNYEEIYKDNSDFFNNSSINNNNNSNFNLSEISYIMPKKVKNKNLMNLYSNSLRNKSLNIKETEFCKQNLHKVLMELQLNKK